jgi:hypothetical protein
MALTRYCTRGGEVNVQPCSSAQGLGTRRGNARYANTEHQAFGFACYRCHVVVNVRVEAGKSTQVCLKRRRECLQREVEGKSTYRVRRVLCVCTVERIHVDNPISPINSCCQEQEEISGESRTHEPCSSLNVVGKGIQNRKLNGHGCKSESLRQSVIVSLQSVVVVVPPPATSSTLRKPSTFFFPIPFLFISEISN